tara:strand:+ start:1177 stop:1509 length:333 start_codon:yes stop_codon:yes gene_type:complete
MTDNIIQFPLKERVRQIEQELEDERLEYEEFTDECRETSQIILLMIEELLLNDSSLFDDIDFRDNIYPEAKDMFVIINLISSMLMRYGGVSHFLHDYFDVIYEQIMETKE